MRTVILTNDSWDPMDRPYLPERVRRRFLLDSIYSSSVRQME